MTKVTEDLIHLEGVGLIKLAQTHPELEFMFRHALVQEMAYDSLLFEDRKKLHRQVAEAMEEVYLDRLDEMAAELARHYTEAGDEEKAVAYLLRAGDHSRQLVALNDAIEFYQAALEHMPESDQAERAETLGKTGECQFLISLYYEAIESFEASESLFEALDDRKRAAAMESKIGDVYWQLGEKEKALQYSRRALTILEQGQESIELARTLSSVSRLHSIFGENAQAIAVGERALELARRLNAEDVITHALNNVGTSYVSVGDADRGLAMLQESLSRALTSSLPHDTARAYFNLGFSLAMMGRHEEAQKAFNSLQVHATDVNNFGLFGFATVPLTQLEWLLGEWKAALVRRHSEFDRFYNPRLPMLIPSIWASSLLGQIYNDLGQPELARQELESMLSKARGADESQTTLPHLAQLVRAYAALGMTGEAEEIGREFLDWFQRDVVGSVSNVEGALSLLAICQWLSAHPNQARLEDAYGCLHQLEFAHKQLGTLVTGVHLSEGRGSVALAEGNYSLAVEQFRQAVAGWKELSRPYDQARALKYLGQALVQSDEARDVFKQAYAIVETLAAQLDDAELKDSFLNSPLVREL